MEIVFFCVIGNYDTAAFGKRLFECGGKGTPGKSANTDIKQMAPALRETVVNEWLANFLPMSLFSPQNWIPSQKLKHSYTMGISHLNLEIPYLWLPLMHCASQL